MKVANQEYIEAVRVAGAFIPLSATIFSYPLTVILSSGSSCTDHQRLYSLRSTRRSERCSTGGSRRRRRQPGRVQQTLKGVYRKRSKME